MMKYCLIVVVLLIANGVAGQTAATAFAYQKSTFKLEGEQFSNASRYMRGAIITGYREGVKPFNLQFGSNWEVYEGPAIGTKRIVMYNLSIVEMLNLYKINPNMVVLEVRDPDKYMYRPEYGDELAWLRKNGWCYEYIMPAGMIGKKTGGNYFDPYIWQAALGDFFGIKFTKETRSIKALVLSRTSTIDKIKSKGVNTGANGTIDVHGNLSNVLLMQMNDFLGKTNLPPLIDETGYDGYVDMNLNISSWTDLPALRKALRRYDLDLKEEMREVKDVMVIKEIVSK